MTSSLNSGVFLMYKDYNFSLGILIISSILEPISKQENFKLWENNKKLRKNAI